MRAGRKAGLGESMAHFGNLTFNVEKDDPVEVKAYDSASTGPFAAVSVGTASTKETMYFDSLSHVEHFANQLLAAVEVERARKASAA